MIGHDHDRGGLVVIESDSLDACRAQGLSDEHFKVLVPLDDVDLLTLEFIDDLANPRSASTNARSNGVDVGIVGDNSDLRAVARFSGDRFDLDVSIDEFWHLKLE